MDADALQNDLNELIKWSKTWQLGFNSSKCKVMHIGNNSSQSSVHNHVMKDEKTVNLEGVNEECDLGIWFDKHLKFSTHVGHVVEKAKKILGLESLPKELQKNFNQMRDLDTQSQELIKEIDKMADDYLVGVRNMLGEKRKEHLSGIQNLFNRSKKFGDEKVQLALQTYELVDRHIRRLDADLARFEAEIKEKPTTIKAAPKEKMAKDKSGSKDKDSKVKKKREKDKDSDGEPSKKKKKKGDDTTVGSIAPLALTLLPLGASHPSDVLDMPVDPNEPTYCLCHQVSYGEMIGCDNPDCPIEWFHFGCVGLTTKPKGKWFCSRCIVERKKKV